MSAWGRRYPAVLADGREGLLQTSPHKNPTIEQPLLIGEVSPKVSPNPDTPRNTVTHTDTDKDQ